MTIHCTVVILPLPFNPDVVRPAFASRVREDHPDIRFVFMSGYVADSDELKEVLHENSTFLSKPFRIKELAKKMDSIC